MQCSFWTYLSAFFDTNCPCPILHCRARLHCIARWFHSQVNRCAIIHVYSVVGYSSNHSTPFATTGQLEQPSDDALVINKLSQGRLPCLRWIILIKFIYLFNSWTHKDLDRSVFVFVFLSFLFRYLCYYRSFYFCLLSYTFLLITGTKSLLPGSLSWQTPKGSYNPDCALVLWCLPPSCIFGPTIALALHLCSEDTFHCRISCSCIFAQRTDCHTIPPICLHNTL